MNIFYIIAILFLIFELLIVIGAIGMVQADLQKIEQRLALQNIHLSKIKFDEWFGSEEKPDRGDLS